MDFLDPKKKKAHKRQLYIGYFLMAIAIFFAGVVLLFAAFGYGIDSKGNVVQSGVVYVNSQPGAAEISYTNVETGTTNRAITEERLNLPAGEYKFELLKEGYRPWQRTLDVRGGRIYRMDYPLLFPDKLETTDADLLADKPDLVTQSPDRSKILVGAEQKGVFRVYETGDPEATPKQVELPSTVGSTSGSSSFTALEWSNNNRDVLLEHRNNGTREFIMFDIEQPGESVNINDAFDISPRDVALVDKQPDVFYLRRNNNNLVKATLSNQQTELVEKNVLDFKGHGSDRLLYIKDRQGKSQVQVKIWGDGESFNIRKLPRSKSYVVDIAQHDGQWYSVVGATNDDEVYVYRNAFEVLRENNPQRLLITRTLPINDPKYASFSGNTQFIAIQNGPRFAVYDVYEDQKYFYKFETPFDTNQQATWMNGHRLSGVVDGKVVVFDFDGQNYQSLTDISKNTPIMFDQGYETMLLVSPSRQVKNRPALTTTPLIIE